MIFLSHNHTDKPVVEPVAIRLREIFGADQVFYDSWSIKPGDGIIDRMNEGLTAPDFVFFFVSAASLASGMVKLEWQNALFAATKGKTRLVPVRVDGSSMPAVLMQTLYIDMHTIGLEAAIAQIVGLVQGNASFTPKHEEFSNLGALVEVAPAGRLSITVSASHLLETAPRFVIALQNEKEDVQSVWIRGQPAVESAFLGQVPGNSHLNGFLIAAFNGGAIRPNMPWIIDVTPAPGKLLRLAGLLHQVETDSWKPVPMR